MPGTGKPSPCRNQSGPGPADRGAGRQDLLDLKAIREDPEPYRKALGRRGAADDLDRALALDEERRRLTVRVEDLRAQQNRGSKEIAAADPASRERVIAALREVSAELKGLEPEVARVEEELFEVSSRLPNAPDEAVPDGLTEEDNVEVRTWGDVPHFDFEPRDHLSLGESLGLIDVERAARTSGSRFTYLTGPAVRIQFALVRMGLDFAEDRGFTPVIPPILVREEAMFGTGFLPTEAVNIYTTREDDLYLVGTAEVPLASLHAHEILDKDELPMRYVGYSTCFRREAGTYGKDMRGIFRVHQFDKLEMFSFVLPDDSRSEHQRFLGWEEEFFRALEVPYRVIDTCTGDLGPAAARKFDLEAWMPSQGRYREVTSTSNTTDFQARRLECRVRLPEGNRTVHTVNGTLCAIGRTLIALLENHQRADGSVALPEALHAYLPQADRVLTPRG